jgi:2-keto-4-pentenoate hydratase
MAAAPWALRVARDLAARRLGGAAAIVAALGPSGAPLTLREGYLVQQELAELLADEPRVVTGAARTATRASAAKFGRLGFKVANTNATSQAFLGAPHPFFGPILPSRAASAGSSSADAAQAESARMQLRLVEPEIALRLARDLPRKADGEPYAATQICECVDAVLGSIEIVHTSYVDWRAVGAPAIVADLASNGCFAFGAPLALAGPSAALPERLADLGCVLEVDGREVGRGRGANALGGPLSVLAWLANAIIEHSHGRHWLREGDIVSTGVIMDPPYHYASRGEQIRATYHGLPHLAPVQVVLN